MNDALANAPSTLRVAVFDGTFNFPSMFFLFARLELLVSAWNIGNEKRKATEGQEKMEAAQKTIDVVM